ncbi:hypothetical protein NE852_31780 (plasmid) [Rhizobium sp. Pop5]|uniref:hypothetical protein n=1 Tax=Rhizobium sp. Pop5 TaxID=1223565 RepID=UPI000283C42A|nr:hypothetical protein [Rhizobium sp. Pop5]EJZ18508.1 hypothetical protein RCCGEPOP_25287 [Rhizobium sp. Pop5]UVD60340.1 hypothetical protein NE852_31780 [Rhizobium sp. Pop5]
MREDINKSETCYDAEAAISAAHLLHPGNHFSHPRDVLAADHIGHEEKRAILASWASDIFAVESIPALRLYPGTNQAVSYDEIVEALKTLDAHGQRFERHCSSSSFDIRQTRHRRPQARRFGAFGLCSYRKGSHRRQPLEI